MLRLIVAIVAALLTVGGIAMAFTLAATGDGDTDTTVRTETVTRTMGGRSSDEVTRAAAAGPLPCSAQDTAQGRIVSNHKPPRLRLIRYCGRGHATVRFRGKTYELLSGHCGRPMKSRSPRRGTESLRHILFGLHGARRPSAEGELWLVPRPGNRPGGSRSTMAKSAPVACGCSLTLGAEPLSLKPA